jgi:hypothetical protein
MMVHPQISIHFKRTVPNRFVFLILADNSLPTLRFPRRHVRVRGTNRYYIQIASIIPGITKQLPFVSSLTLTLDMVTTKYVWEKKTKQTYLMDRPTNQTRF